MMARTTSGLVTVHDNPASFTCSQCGAHYKVVRVKAQTQSLDHLLRCKVCKQPLAATDGEDILKYFLTSQPAKKPQAVSRL
jgi:transcription elongation factor Elf1